MRPGSAVATACLAVLSVWRFVDGEPVWAAVFAGLALVQLGFALRRPAAGTRVVLPADPARRTWVRIAVANLVLAVAAVFWFPPLALVLAGLGLYSTYRARVPGANSLNERHLRPNLLDESAVRTNCQDSWPGNSRESSAG